MQVTTNFKGTLYPSFTIGKNGTTLYQGAEDPTPTYTINAGDYWLDSSDNSLKVWSSGTSSWHAPKLADITFVDSTISTESDDLILQTNGLNAKVTFAGDTGPGIITASSSQNLYIDPSIGGGADLILIDNKWPSSDGTVGQVMTTDGSGNLSFSTINTVGSPSPSTTSTTGFGYIPVTTGTPTGIPTSISGYVPIIADSGGTKIWVYISGSWKYITLT